MKPVWKNQNKKSYKGLKEKGNFCHLLITFANRLDPDQDQQNVGSDLESKLNDSLKGCLNDFMIKKVSRQHQKHEKLPSMQRVKKSYTKQNTLHLEVMKF